MRRLALASLSLLAIAATPAGAATAKTTLPAIESQVMCVTCGVVLEVAESPAADQERQFIQGLIDEGLTVAQIKHQLVLQYGNGVLALPPASGFNVALYVLPPLALVAALTLVAILLPRWRRHRPNTTPPQNRPLNERDAARLEEDLARFDR
jgi:cytochrome c-type biogenesis protein CcmH